MKKRDRWPEWLRKLPSDWDAPYLKLVARVESGHTPSRSVDEYWRPEECTIPWFSLADIWQLREGRQKYLGETAEKVSPAGLANSSARLLPRGTVVLSRTASVGFSGIMPRPMATTQDFVNFVPGPKLASDYLLWVLRGMTPEFERLRMGSTHKTIYMPDVLEFRSPTPPLDAQRTIADFLDRKTAAIDDLIAQKERLIELLQEKRQALLTQAVTKGLDPSVPMKESGVEWIGEVPAHWSVVRLSRHLVRNSSGTWGDDPLGDGSDTTVLRSTEVELNGAWKIVEPAERQVSAGEVARQRLAVGDLVLTKSSGSEAHLGKVALVDVDVAALGACASNFMQVLHPTADLCAQFLHHFMNSHPGREQLLTLGTTTTGLRNLSGGIISQLSVPKPPIQEQLEISRAATAESQLLEAAARQILDSLALLREYRQALITNAVTGQLDIPGAA